MIPNTDKHFIRKGITEVDEISNKPKVLFACIEAPTYSSKGMIKGFEDNGYEVIVFDWQKVRFNEGVEGMKDRLYYKAMMERPELIFLHIQNEDAVDAELAIGLQSIAFTINYTFDVRSKEKTAWMYELAQHIGLTLFSNQDDVNICKALGISKVGIMQSSCDTNWYKKLKGLSKDDNSVVFIGNNNENSNLNFDNAGERQAMIKFLYSEYSRSFNAYGLGQKNNMINPQQEISLYNTSSIAISHNNYDRELYTSDRLWRIMACGCFCLTKYFKGVEAVFERGIHLDWWHDFNELKEKIDYYILNADEREAIAAQGHSKVIKNHTWTDRFNELSCALKKLSKNGYL